MVAARHAIGSGLPGASSPLDENLLVLQLLKENDATMARRTAFAILLIVSFAGPAAADCVKGLALCAIECDQRTKPGTPDRPQCARACVSNYPKCERIELLQSNTGARKDGPATKLAPGQ